MTGIAEKEVSRRKFLKGGTVAAGAAAGALAMPSVVTAQSPIVLKMQSSWPATDIFQEHGAAVCRPRRTRCRTTASRSTCCRPARSSARSTCRTPATTARIDAAHTVPVYWYGKHKGASLFGTGPVFGGTAADMLGLVLPGRRQGLLPRAGAGHPRPERRRLLRLRRCRRSRSAGSRTRSPAPSS